MQCIEWKGPRREYQEAAAIALIDAGATLSPYIWITPKCDTDVCLEAVHLVVHSPVRLAYPSGVCIYCGGRAFTRDHLLPRSWTGEAVRKYTVVVPACGVCNTLLGSALTWSITERRDICHTRLRKKYAKALRTVSLTKKELREYGPLLRTYLTDEIEKRREVERMLAWPEDPFYDLRALEKSGIEDPYAIGLLKTISIAA